MRVLKLLITEADREPVLSILDEEGIDYVLFEDVGTDAEDLDEMLIEFPLPNQAVEYVRSRLDESDVGEEYVLTIGAESARTERMAALEDRFVTGTEAGDSISPEELRTRALELQPDPLPYHVMTLLSAIVAVAGLLLGSAALVVGAMVISPQVGSALTASVGATFGDWPMLNRGIRDQVVSLGLAILGAAVFGLALQSLGFVSPVVHLETIAEVGERTSPGVLTMATGIAAGIAGAIGLATAFPVSIVGVMIAAALIPAAAATGIGLAWNEPSVAVGAAVLLVANLLAVNLAGFVTLRGFGYGSTDYDRDAVTARMAIVVVAIVGMLVLTGAAFATQATYENDVNEAVTDVLDEEDYEELGLVRTQMDFVLVPSSDEPVVNVVVHRPVDQSYPTLAADLEAAIEDSSDRQITVQVEYVDRQSGDDASG